MSTSRSSQPAKAAGLLLTLLLAFSLPVQADCKRPIRVPLAAMGMSLVVEPDGQLRGAVPDWLQRLGEMGGCRFHTEAMPRARAELLFQRAGADVLLPATRTPQRDAIAEFVPLMQSRPTLVYRERPGLVPPRSIAELLRQSTLRLALVRGYDYGPAYQELVAGLRQRGRLVVEADPQGVARALASGLADATVLNSAHLHGLIEGDARLAVLVGSLRSEALEELPWSDSGLYLSTRSLDVEDRLQLRRLFETQVPLFWQLMRRHYPSEALEGSLRPR